MAPARLHSLLLRVLVAFAVTFMVGYKRELRGSPAVVSVIRVCRTNPYRVPMTRFRNPSHE
jgi:hypothetical protein